MNNMGVTIITLIGKLILILLAINLIKYGDFGLIVVGIPFLLLLYVAVGNDNSWERRE